MPTVPAPTTNTEPPSGTFARRAAWIAHANGSSSTATSSLMESGTRCSCE